jgi:signal peptidase I
VGLCGGLMGAVAWLGDKHPLVLGAALFAAYAEALRHWKAYLAIGPTPAAMPASGPPLRRTIVALLAVALAAFALRSSVAAVFRVVGPSMLPTLEAGDRMLLDRLAYGVRVPLTTRRFGARPPARGDMVVFKATGPTGADGAQSIVKRVIGLPGDRVAFTQGTISINDWSVPTCDAGPYATLLGSLAIKGRLVVEFLGDQTYLTVRKPIERDSAPYAVAPGDVFVMGDDRGMSSDSRFWNENRGAGIPIAALEGRVSRVLLGARPDGTLDFSRLWSPALELGVHLQGFDTSKADDRIAACLAHRPATTWPPARKTP